MNWTTIIATLISSLLCSGGVTVVFLNHILNKKETATAELREVNEDISATKTEWYDLMFEVVKNLKFKASGRDINGDLDKAFDEYENTHKKLKNLYIKKSRVGDSGGH